MNRSQAHHVIRGYFQFFQYCMFGMDFSDLVFLSRHGQDDCASNGISLSRFGSVCEEEIGNIHTHTTTDIQAI